ncbi:MAG: Stealth CR1 domain-containing protein [Lachnotalea sp.]
MKSNYNEKIDFVLIWVDGNDPAWREEKAKYDGSTLGFDDSDIRYRDWGNLQYWFRGVEKYAPWVNKIHFVTWGHLPEWLDTTDPRLNIVNHKDYIPEKYLPTFNANTIELNLHRIAGLAEQFVYFNDDMFITRPVKPTDFFAKGKPKDIFSLNAIYFDKKSAGYLNGNDMELINSNFKKDEAFKKNSLKWYHPIYGGRNIMKTMFFMKYPWFPGFYYNHLPSNFLKSTFKEVWEKESETLDATCMDKFRNKTNVNQWLMKFWQLAGGEFEPGTPKIGRCFHIREKRFLSTLDAISAGKYKLICINDTVNISDFDAQKNRVIEAFDTLLSDKSDFEKDMQ